VLAHRDSRARTPRWQVLFASAADAEATWRAAGGGPAGPGRAWTLVLADFGFHGWAPAAEAALERLVAGVRAAEAAARGGGGGGGRWVARIVAAAAAPIGNAQEVADWLGGGGGGAVAAAEDCALAARARAKGPARVRVIGAAAADGGAEEREAARCCAAALRAGDEVRSPTTSPPRTGIPPHHLLRALQSDRVLLLPVRSRFRPRVDVRFGRPGPPAGRAQASRLYMGRCASPSKPPP
jgi:hypothetical protein